MAPQEPTFQKSVNSGTMKKIEFSLNHPEVLDEDLVDACRGMVNGWGDRLIKKLILEGLAGWVDPALSFRQAYYNVTADTDGTKHGLDQRYSYMTAAARIEEAIPDQVLAFMKRSGYISIYSWDGVKRDLYVLIVVIEDFMRGYAKLRTECEQEMDERAERERFYAGYDSDEFCR